MAIRDLVRTGAGMMAQITEIKSHLDSLSAVQTIITKINGGLSLGDGLNSSQAGNIDAQYIDFYFSAANTEYEIPWSKERIAIGYDVVRRSKAGHIYDSNVGQWSPTALFLKSDVADITVRLRVY